jgi:hypothetical protein
MRRGPAAGEAVHNPACDVCAGIVCGVRHPGGPEPRVRQSAPSSYAVLSTQAAQNPDDGPIFLRHYQPFRAEEQLR